LNLYEWIRAPTSHPSSRGELFPGAKVMLDDQPFRELLAQMRGGDAAAAAELVRMCESTVRRVVRLRMRFDSPLRRGIDSIDICQSVLASFFVRSALGQYDLDKPEDLLKLLAVMARNKLVDEARRPQVVRRRFLSGETASNGSSNWVDTQPDASRRVAARELLGEVQRRLTPDERYLVEQRVAGRHWADLAAELGGTAEALRKKHARALDRVAAELHLDEVDLA
jgi:RNA polymerase sigma factor (sigma-70 family)